MTIRAVFDWLSQQPEQQYTLGEALFGRHDITTLPFNRGGRIIERAITAASVVAGAAMWLTGNPLGLSIIFNGKQAGMIGAVSAEIVGEIGHPPARKKNEFTGLER